MPLWSAPMAGALLFLCYSAFSCSASPSGHSCCKKGALDKGRTREEKLEQSEREPNVCVARLKLSGRRHSHLFPRCDRAAGSLITLRMSNEAGQPLTAEEVAFLAGDQQITIPARTTLSAMQLLDGDIGEISALRQEQVPLWLALFLKGEANAASSCQTG